MLIAIFLIFYNQELGERPLPPKILPDIAIQSTNLGNF